MYMVIDTQAEGWVVLAGSAATEMNHRLSNNRSNQCVKLFIDYLYLNFTV